jgi:undecaprenol kinase
MKRERNRLFKSFGYAKTGFFHALQHEKNLQIHLLMTCIVIPSAFLLDFDTFKWSILLLTIGIVISLELINTAIERVVDLITTDFHPLAKNAKDVAAAAVFVFTIVAVFIGLLLFLPPIWDIFN